MSKAKSGGAPPASMLVRRDSAARPTPPATAASTCVARSTAAVLDAQDGAARGGNDAGRGRISKAKSEGATPPRMIVRRGSAAPSYASSTATKKRAAPRARSRRYCLA